MSHLVVNSEFTRRKADALHGGFARARVCWLATEEDTPPPTAPPGAERSPNVLIVGRLVGDRPKGHRELIACWPRVVSEVPAATLHIVGDGPDRQALEALAAQSPVASAIVFHGFVPESGLATHYPRSRVYAMPSRGEGFGLVYVEAMRHGLPVIGSVHDAASEVLVGGKTGYVVDQDDVEALTAAVARLLREPARAAELGEAGRRRWAESFRYSAFRERFEVLLDEFLAP
jgi:phosphatidylinositol alpha-1,6-mannosyltransferase